ncbi:MAG: hypothetical protein WDN48_16425 [Pseudolabrys sp.]
MRRALLVAFALLVAAPALAQEPVGCDKFKWPLDKERALLANASAMDSGGDIARPLDAAVKVALVPYADAKLPVTPERVPRSPDTNAGMCASRACQAWNLQDHADRRRVDRSGPGRPRGEVRRV